MTGRRLASRFCGDCPDHEACSTGYPCSVVRRAASAPETEHAVAESSTQKPRRQRPLWMLRWGTRLTPSLRREQRAMLAALVADREGRRPWYGEGTALTHYAIDLMTPISLCWRRLGEVSNLAPRTLIGATCPTCVRAWTRAVNAWLADPATVHKMVEARLSHPGGRKTQALVCGTCTTAANPNPDTPVPWPCTHASTDEVASHASAAAEWQSAQDRKKAWRVLYDETYAALTADNDRPDLYDLDAHLEAAKVANAAHPDVPAPHAADLEDR